MYSNRIPSAPSTSPNDHDTSHSIASLTISVDHPCLTKTDPSSICTFLKAYYQYCRTVIGKAKQLQAGADAADKTIITEASIPMKLKYCIDATHFSSYIALGLIKDATSFDSLTEAKLRDYLDESAAESKDTATLEGLDELVTQELVMDMSNLSAKFRMQNLSIDYHSLLTKGELKWIVSDNQKLAVSHVLSAIYPESLRARLQSDLPISHYDLINDFKKFLSHAVNLSEAFHIVDSGPCRRPKMDRTDNRLGNPGASPKTDANSGMGR